MFDRLSVWLRPFIWDSRNPHRRYCRKCGQCQERYSRSDITTPGGWWEPMGLIHDASCSCHKTVSGHFRPDRHDQADHVLEGVSLSERPRFRRKKGWSAITLNGDMICPLFDDHRQFEQNAVAEAYRKVKGLKENTS